MAQRAMKIIVRRSSLAGDAVQARISSDVSCAVARATLQLSSVQVRFLKAVQPCCISRSFAHVRHLSFRRLMFTTPFAGRSCRRTTTGTRRRRSGGKSGRRRSEGPQTQSGAAIGTTSDGRCSRLPVRWAGGCHELQRWRWTAALDGRTVWVGSLAACTLDGPIPPQKQTPQTFSRRRIRFGRREKQSSPGRLNSQRC